MPGIAANRVELQFPDGTSLALFNGESRVFSVERTSDQELRTDTSVKAFGSAYANITYTFI
jgi:hypothetical protein